MMAHTITSKFFHLLIIYKRKSEQWVYIKITDEYYMDEDY